MEKELEGNIKQTFSVELSIKMMEYFVFQQFDEWQDIADDINNGYDDCCCKEILFQQLNITNIKQKIDGYNRLKQCMPSRLSLQRIHNNIIVVFSYYFDSKIANKILELFKFICNDRQITDIQSMRNDVETNDITNSKIISYIYNKTYNIINNAENLQFILSRFLKHIINGKTLQFIQNQSYKVNMKDQSFMNQFHTKMRQIFIFNDIFEKQTANKIVEACFDYIKEQQFDDIDSIKDDLENDIENSEILQSIFENINDLLPHQYKQYDKQIITQNINNIIAELINQRKRFNITNFVFKLRNPPNNDQKNDDDDDDDDYNRRSIDDSLEIAKKIELMNGFPILMWLLDTFSRDRINKYKENMIEKQTIHQEQVSEWLKNNVFYNLVHQQNPWMAIKIKSAIKVLIKRNLPSIQLNPGLNQSVIYDSLNQFVKYALDFHHFAHEVIVSMRLKQYECAPVQFDFMIIPKPSKTASFGHAHISYDQNSIYFQGKDYFVQKVEKDLVKQLLSIYNNKNLGLTKQRHKRYIIIINRNGIDEDSVTFIIPKQCDKLPKQWNQQREKALYLAQNYIIPPLMTLNDKTKEYICLSHQIFTQNTTKTYVFVNGGGHKFELDDISILWPIHFNKINGKNQSLSQQLLNDIHEYNINKKFRNDDFEEFQLQCKRLKIDQPDILQLSEHKQNEIDVPPIDPVIVVIRKTIHEIFSGEFNKGLADKILKSFNDIIEEEQFNRWDLMYEDTEDASNSSIISKILEDVEDSLHNHDKQNQRQTIINILTQIVKQKGEYVHIISNSTEPLLIPILNSITYNLTSMRVIEINQSFVNNVEHSNHEQKLEHVNDAKKDKLNMENIIRKTFNKMAQTKLIEDLQSENSIILNGIFDAVGHKLVDKNLAKKLLQQDIDAIVLKKRYFVLTNLKFNVNRKEIKETTELLFTHCPKLFTHPGSDDTAQDKSLCVTKTIDVKNGIPLLLWLLDMFTRYRIDQHEKNHKSGIPIQNDNVAINYDINKWFDNDNLFCNYIVYTYRSIKPNIATIFKSALNSLSLRALPVLNFSAILIPKIYDSLNAFIKYTLATHHFVLSIIKDELEFVFPTQFDCWIIPQGVKMEKLPQPYSSASNANHEVTLNSDKRKIHLMCKDSQPSATQFNSFWDLEHYLKLSGYRKNKDYFVEAAVEPFGELKQQLRKIWYRRALGSRYRSRRYIIIIDRRDPRNLSNKNMSKYKLQFDAPNSNGFYNNYGTNKFHKDKIYLIIAKEEYMRYNRSKPKPRPNDEVEADQITNRFYLLNEYPLGQSKEFIFPYPENEGDRTSVSIIDSMNGYKFALSYHLFQSDHCKCYWYLNGGSRFELDDMLWLWPKYFSYVRNEPQRVDAFNTSIYNETERLPNPRFDEFLKQANDINNIKFQEARNALKKEMGTDLSRKTRTFTRH